MVQFGDHLRSRDHLRRCRGDYFPILTIFESAVGFNILKPDSTGLPSSVGAVCAFIMAISVYQTRKTCLGIYGRRYGRTRSKVKWSL